MSAIFGVLGTSATLVLLALVATGIVAFHRGHLTFPTIAHTYTAFLLAVCIALALAGGALLISPSPASRSPATSAIRRRTSPAASRRAQSSRPRRPPPRAQGPRRGTTSLRGSPSW